MSSRAAPRRARTGDARVRAADVLVRVETDGAFAAPALDAALDREPALHAADRGLATELVYGVLRSAAALDARLGRHAPRAGSIAALDPYTRAVMRIGAYQILALARIPPRAAVHAAVETLKHDRSPGLAGFANALLRKLSAERPEPLPDDARETLALAAVSPSVVATLSDALGSEDAARSVLRAAFSRTPPTGLRVQPTRATREQLAARLREERPDAVITESTLSPLALRVTGGGELANTEAYRDGWFALQEEGAQCVALAAGVQPGMRVLDACAGRGGKTGALATAMDARGVLHAVEMYPEKVARIGDELARLGLRGESLAFEAAAADLTRGLGALANKVPDGGYDVVVVDAPCSGLGTIARRPDILVRKGVVVRGSDDASGAASEDEGAAGARAKEARMELPALQRAILEQVASRVRVGGVLVYAVCTLARAEGPDVVAAFRAQHPEFVPAEGGDAVPTALRSATVTLRPDIDGTDGFMVFRLRRDAIA